jgi:hypothetical protein
MLTIGETERPTILVVYGRRRIGKTELIEQTYFNRRIFKLEGIENKPKLQQIEQVLYQLSKYLEDPHIAKLSYKNWVEVFDFIADRIDLNDSILYFEEVQWLANYEDDLISELKYVWDNRFRHNKNFVLVLCGSSPSFMINHVLHSKALYNRSITELHLDELSIQECQQLLKKSSQREVMTAYLTIGGIPEYLLRLPSSLSVLLGIAEQSFVQNSYFLNEYKRIFISSMAKNPYYIKTIEYLSRKRFATRDEISNHLKITTGGSLTDLLNDLELCGFIEKYIPYNSDPNSLLSRYCIRDSYLMFYYKFIKPISKKISQGVYNNDPIKALKMPTFEKWMGFAFERFVRRNAHWIAKILGFQGIEYRSGVFFNRSTNQQESGYQFDLVFERSDHVYTLCEIRYYSDLVGTSIISEMESKIALFPKKKSFSIQRVLITTEGASKALIERNYFDAIITLSDLFAIL